MIILRKKSPIGDLIKFEINRRKLSSHGTVSRGRPEGVFFERVFAPETGAFFWGGGEGGDVNSSRTRRILSKRSLFWEQGQVRSTFALQG